MEFEVLIPCGLVTSMAEAWGGKAREQYQASQEAIRDAIQKHMNRKQLRVWLDSRTKLQLTVESYLNKQRANQTDIDSLLSDLFNPLVEGACGPRAGGKPIPQTKDALF